MGVTRLYTTNRIYKALASTHKLDEEMRKAITQNDYNRIIALFKDSSGNLKPTNPSKLRFSKIDTIKPKGRIVPTHFFVKQTQINQKKLNRILEILNELRQKNNFDQPFLTENDTLYELLELSFGMMNFDENGESDLEVMKHIIKNSTREQNSYQAYLFVRENREISRLAPMNLRFINSPEADDIREVAFQTATNLPLLMLLGQKGEKRKEIKMGQEFDIGWDDQPFYWPLLFTPDQMKTFIYEKNF